MPAPRQAPDALRRRLRVIRRLGLEKPDELHKSTLDRFTRLAVSIFKTKRALVSVIGRERQVFLSEIGMGAKSTSFEDAFCCHTIIGNGESCMVVPDAANDWRFAKNPLVDEGKGIVQFYAGAPLRVGQGPKAAIIGSMCIIDDVPRHDFDEEGKRLLADLAECAVSEVSRYADWRDEAYRQLELLYNQRATVEAAKLHQSEYRAGQV
jgi:GAF domain-containing protein